MKIGETITMLDWYVQERRRLMEINKRYEQQVDYLQKQLIFKGKVLLFMATYLPCNCRGELHEDYCLKKRIECIEKKIKERDKGECKR